MDFLEKTYQTLSRTFTDCALTTLCLLKGKNCLTKRVSFTELFRISWSKEEISPMLMGLGECPFLETVSEMRILISFTNLGYCQWLIRALIQMVLSFSLLLPILTISMVSMLSLEWLLVGWMWLDKSKGMVLKTELQENSWRLLIVTIRLSEIN